MNMSRQQQRHMLRQVEKVPADVREYIEMCAVNSAACAFHALYALSLNSQFGFGTKRINTLIDKVMKQFACINSGHLGGEDAVKWCKDNGINYKSVEVDGV